MDPFSDITLDEVVGGDFILGYTPDDEVEGATPCGYVPEDEDEDDADET